SRALPSPGARPSQRFKRASASPNRRAATTSSIAAHSRPVEPPPGLDSRHPTTPATATTIDKPVHSIGRRLRARVVPVAALETGRGWAMGRVAGWRIGTRATRDDPVDLTAVYARVARANHSIGRGLKYRTEFHMGNMAFRFRTRAWLRAHGCSQERV